MMTAVCLILMHRITHHRDAHDEPAASHLVCLLPLLSFPAFRSLCLPQCSHCRHLPPGAPGGDRGQVRHRGGGGAGERLLREGESEGQAEVLENVSCARVSLRDR